MDEKVRGKASRPATDARQQPGTSERPEDYGHDPLTKGAMREPAQTPDGERGPSQELQEALENLEKEKGDWSKGG